jgi:hypothetical protein
VKGKRASESNPDAFVEYSHTFKRGDGREQHIAEIGRAVSSGFANAERDMGEYIARKLNDNARRVGL